MEAVSRPGGVRLRCQAAGSGPLAVLAPYWSGHPGVFERLLGDLSRDHRVVAFDARGTGRSTRSGPYDIVTDADDLLAVIEAAGGPAIVLALANGGNVALMAAARRADAVRAVVALGTAPFALRQFGGRDAMISSPAVIEAFVSMVESNYRAAMRTLLSATNPQMSEEELAARVALQVDFCPAEAASGRLRAWIADDPTDRARALGERLIVLRGPNVAGPWLPPDPELDEIMARTTPAARSVRLEDGAVSRPDLTAAAIRELAG